MRLAVIRTVDLVTRRLFVPVIPCLPCQQMMPADHHCPGVSDAA